MSGPDDTLPPDSAANDNTTDRPPPLIPKGFARHAVSAALSDVYRAMELLEATADAVARALDAEEDALL